MKKTFTHKLVLGAALVLTPAISKAQTFKSIADDFSNLLATSVITLLSAAVLASFIWSLLRLIGAQGDTGKRQEAKKWLVWGLLGMFVLVGLWGIVSFIGSTFGITFGGEFVDS